MLSTFHSWRARLTAALGALPDRLRYSRNAAQPDDRQVASHIRQGSAADAKWGAIASMWWWSDTCSGTTFDRPGFQDMLDFCRTYPRSADNPGRVEIYDPSRFGRILDADGGPDIHAFMSVYGEFERLGWQPNFVTVQRSGSAFADLMTIATHAHAAAVHSISISKNATRGKRARASQGWWVSGPAPWGTKRSDTMPAHALKAGRLSTRCADGTILVPDENALELWNEMADRFISGASLNTLCIDLFERGIRGPGGGKLGLSTIRKFLTNVVLIGRVGFMDEEEGTRVQRVVPAKWNAMVDEALFERVQAEFDQRAKRYRRATQTQRGIARG